MALKCNCCDGIYNSLDVHFTSACDNKCAHCVDACYSGLELNRPNVAAITDTIMEKAHLVDDVLFLGGEPCLYLEELYECVLTIKAKTTLKVFVTSAMPKVCYDKKALFYHLLDIVDGFNISAQHHIEEIADKIRATTSMYDRQSFYANLPHKHKIRVNLNVVRPYLHTKEQLTECLKHYDRMGFNSIKLSEIQHGTEHYISFADIFGIKLKSAYAHGCQTYLEMDKIIPDFRTPVLLKRSCFLCEESLTASLADGLKMLTKFFIRPDNTYGVVYENGKLTKGWV
jgi:MoaA/NifB/PqqE/SkfB family radical SAM enzyme